MLWVESQLAALLLARVHRANGYDAYVLWDTAEERPMVATTWPMG